MSMQTITPAMAAALGLSQRLRRHRVRRLAGRPGGAAGLKVGDILVSMDGQPADNLPTVNYNFRLRDSTDKVQLVVLRGRRGAESRRHAGRSSAASSTPCRRWPIREKNLVPELGILGVEIDRAHCRRGHRAARSVRHHRRRPRGGRGERSAAAAAGHHPQPEQPHDADARRRLKDAMRALKPGSPVTLQIQREGRLMYVSFTLE